MASLVADYSSESDDDDEGLSGVSKSQQAPEKTTQSQVCKRRSGVTRIQFSVCLFQSVQRSGRSAKVAVREAREDDFRRETEYVKRPTDMLELSERKMPIRTQLQVRAR